MPDHLLDQPLIVDFRCTKEQVRAAALAVCAMAEDAEEAKTIMSMLGLIKELKS